MYISAVRSYTGEYAEDLKDSTGYDGRLGDFTTDTLDSEMVVRDEEHSCGLGD